ncbi:MAG: toxin-antitoxin system, toxin component, PIN family protein [Planctomycetota bacterium]|nr:MAG: toxin-antitoxin system, toxin component, PIN family protein [Planctomycetota bacterium]
MRILLVTCVWGGAADELRHAQRDVVWSGDWPTDPGEEELPRQAHADNRIFVTLDKDFGELAILRRSPHHGILRLAGIAARRQAAVCLHVLGHHGDELLAGAIITVEPGRIRIRPPDKP